jgi:hypothetical protein
MRVNVPKIPILTDIYPLVVGVSFEDAPVGNVTIEATGDLITTVSKEITPTEAVNGVSISLLANTTQAGRKVRQVTLTCSGYSDIVFDVWVTSSHIQVTGSNYRVYRMLMDGVSTWKLEVPTFTLGQLTSKRNDLINDLFKDTIDTDFTPYSVTNNPAGANGVTFDNVNGASSVLLYYRKNDADGYYYEAQVGADFNPSATVLVFDCNGHGEPGHQELYDACMDAGYDYAVAELTYPITNNPNITISFPVDRHNQLLTAGVDNADFDARSLFLFHLVKGLRWLLNNKSYSKVIITGISGGAQMVALWQAIDPITDLVSGSKVFAVRGTGPRSQPFGGGDFEQGSGALDKGDYDTNEGNSGPRVLASMLKHTRLDWYGMAVASGVEFHHMTHEIDSCCWKGWYNEIPEYEMQQHFAAQNFPGQYIQWVNTDSDEAVHGYHAGDINYILNNV